MSTVRRSRRRPALRLSLALADFLTGVHRTADDMEAIQAQGVPYDGFLRFDLDSRPAAEIDVLRDQHATALAATTTERAVDWARVTRDVQAARAARWPMSVRQAAAWGVGSAAYWRSRRDNDVPDTFEPPGV